MSSNYKEPLPDPNAQNRRPTSELWGPWGAPGENKQQQQNVPETQLRRPGNEIPVDAQFVHREHVTGSLASYPAEASAFRAAPSPYPQFPGYSAQEQRHPQQPGYAPSNVPSQQYPAQSQGYLSQRQGYPSYLPVPGYAGSPQYPSQQRYVSPPPGYTPYAPGYPAYNGYTPYAYYPYPYAWQPPKPKRDGYLFGVAISALVGSGLLFLGGLFALGFLALYAIAPRQNISESSNFAAIVLFISFALAGLLGGVFGLYHSIRSVFLRKPSADFSVPRFWIFVILYLVVVGIGFVLKAQGQEVAFPALTTILIMLAGLLPALAVLALGVRRLHFPREAPWSTSWRRFTLALISGATLSIALAGMLELVLQILLVRGQVVNPLICVDRPNATGCQDPAIYNIILIMVAVIAPLVEETVKPLAVVILIGRVRSAAEAFVLGLACGIGFDLIETTGYISSGYHDWLQVTLERTGAGLLHGFGAAMVALGWYYITHAKKRRWLLALGCWSYAMLQHALWNGSLGLVLLPAPVGNFFNSNLMIGPVPLPSFEIINIIELIFMLAFFIYMTGKLRTKTPPSSSSERSEQQPAPERQYVLPG